MYNLSATEEEGPNVLMRGKNVRENFSVASEPPGKSQQQLNY